MYFCCLGTYFVSKSGDGDCSLSIKPCGSIKTAFGKTASSDSISLISDDLNPETSQTIISHSVSINNYEREKKTNLPVDEVGSGTAVTPLFYIQAKTGSITFRVENISFVLSEGLKSPISPVISGESGFIYVSSCEFKRETVESGKESVSLTSCVLKSKNIINVNNCLFEGLTGKEGSIITKNIRISDSTFNNIERSEGNGGGIEAVGNTLDINHCIFNNCVCLNGYGGGIYCEYSGSFLNIYSSNSEGNIFKRCCSCLKGEENEKESNEGENGKGGGIYLKISSFVGTFMIKDIIFGGVSGEENKGGSGSNIFIESDYIETYIDERKTPFLEGVSSSDKSYMFCLESNKDNEYNLGGLMDGSIHEGYSEVFVGSKEGSDGSCSSANNACSDITVGINKVTLGRRNITFVNSFSHSSNITFNKGKYYFKNNDENTEINVNSGYLNVWSESTFEGLSFKFSQNYKEMYLFNCLYSTIQFIDCSFSPSSSSSSLSSVSSIIRSVGADLHLDDCSFSNFSSSSSSSSYSVINWMGGYLYVTGCSFYQCKRTNDNGGAMYIKVNLDSYIYFNDSNGKKNTFDGCSAKKGGALFFCLSNNPSSIYVDGITFGGIMKNTATNGYNIFVESRSLESIVNYETFPALLGLNKEDLAFEGSTTLSASSGPYTDLVNLVNADINEPAMLYVGDGGGVDNDCSASDVNKLCSNLVNALSKINIKKANVTIVGCLTCSGCELNNKRGYSFIGGDGEGEIKTNNDFQFSILKDCEFNNLIFSLSSEMNNNIMSVNGGKLSLYCVGLRGSEETEAGVSVLSNSLIKIINSKEVKIDKCNISNVEIREGSGGGINGIINNDDVIIIKGCLFNNCKVNKGNGGGIYVEIKEGGSFSVEKFDETKSSFKLCSAVKEGSEGGRGGGIYMKFEGEAKSFSMSEVEFGGGEEENKGEGSDLFVEAVNIKELFTKNYFPFITATREDYNKEMGVEGDNKESAIPLVIFVSDEPSSYYVNGLENNNNYYYYYCGFEYYPCKNLEAVFNKVKGKEKNIIISGGINEDGEILLNDNKYIINKGDNNINVNVGSGCSFVISVNSEFNNIPFILPSSLSHNLISISSGLLTLSSSSFYPSSGSCSVSASLLYLSSSGSASLSLCSFRSVTLLNGNGGSINALLSSSCSLNIKGCLFNNCKVNKGNGGGIYVEIKDNGSIIIDKEGNNNTIIKGCCALKEKEEDDNNNNNNNGISKNGNKINDEEEEDDDDGGRGGGIYIKVGDSYNSILINNINFGGEKEVEENKGEGYDLFVEAKDLSSVMNEKNFPFLKEKEEEYEGCIGKEEGKEETVSLVEVFNGNNNNNKDDDDDGDGGLEGWKIALIVIAVVVVVIIIIVIIIIVIILMKKKKGNDDESKTDLMEEMKGEKDVRPASE